MLRIRDVRKWLFIWGIIILRCSILQQQCKGPNDITSIENWWFMNKNKRVILNESFNYSLLPVEIILIWKTWAAWVY